MRRHLLVFVGIFLTSGSLLGAAEEVPFQFITLDLEDAPPAEKEAAEKTKEQPVLPHKKVKRKARKKDEQHVELVQLNSTSFAPVENKAASDDESALLEQNIASIDQDLYQPAELLVEKEDKKESNIGFDVADLEQPDLFITSSPAAEENQLFADVKQETSKKVSSTRAAREKEMKAVAKAQIVNKAVAPQSVSDASAAVQVSFAHVFAGSPVIYSILLALSVFALCICLYNVLSLKGASEHFVRKIRQKLMSNQFDDALSLCLKDDHLFSRVVGAAISTRKHGLPHMLETMKTEGKRATVSFWQRIALLNDIAIVAPMLGLLGTVLGMFYAFYDLNRSRESVNTLFDGLGISVGTTVAGLAVAIIAMMLHALAKFRLVRVLATVEEEAQSLATLMEAKPTFPTDK
ncbi:MAG: MotA/TolQ/ExbB proton channel family protein [Chlamydiales bacterium]